MGYKREYAGRSVGRRWVAYLTQIFIPLPLPPSPLLFPSKLNIFSSQEDLVGRWILQLWLVGMVIFSTNREMYFFFF